MARRRWVYIDGEAIEVSPDYVPPPRNVPVVGDRHYDGLRTTDGVDISTRTKHREYMRERGVTTADDYTGYWAKEAERRAKVFTEGGDWKDHKDRREDIARVLSEHLDKRR